MTSPRRHRAAPPAPGSPYLCPESSMIRRLALTILALAAGSVPAVAQTPAPSHAQMHAMLMSGAPMDSAQCATFHAALRQHFADLQLDSTQMSAVHSMLLAHAGIVQLDSSQLESVHGTLQQAVANGTLDADHVAMFQKMLSDSTHLAAIRTCFAPSTDGRDGKAPRRQ
jgi:hypothetical protein